MIWQGLNTAAYWVYNIPIGYELEMGNLTFNIQKLAYNDFVTMNTSESENIIYLLKKFNCLKILLFFYEDHSKIGS